MGNEFAACNVTSGVDVNIGSTFALVKNDQCRLAIDEFKSQIGFNDDEKIFNDDDDDDYDDFKESKQNDISATIEWIDVFKPFESTKGSGADEIVYFYAVPNDALKEYQYPIGIVCKKDKEGARVPVIVGKEGVHVKAAQNGKCVKVWDDRGSGKENNYQFWRLVAPEGFVALSDIPALKTKLSNNRTHINYKGIWCVSKQLVKQLDMNALRCVWTSKGSGATHDASVWSTNDTEFMSATTVYCQEKIMYGLDCNRIGKLSNMHPPHCSRGHKLINCQVKDCYSALTYDSSQKCLISIKGTHGTYLCAESDGKAICNRKHCNAWEQFWSIPLGNNKVGLFSHHKKYLSAQPNGKLEANRDQLLAWETFTVVEKNSRFGLLSVHNKYVSAQQNGVIEVNRNHLLDWELFQIDVIKSTNYKASGVICVGCNDSFYKSSTRVWHCNQCNIYDLCLGCGMRKLLRPRAPLPRRVLRPGNSLKSGQCLSFCSPSHSKTKLVMQHDDGNLCLYHGDRCVWDTWHMQKVGPLGGGCEFKNENKLCLYNYQKQVMWCQESVGNLACKLVLGDGNMWLLGDHDNKPLWRAIRRIKNPHVIIIGIKKYDKQPYLSKITQDVQKMYELWDGHYGFKHISMIGDDQRITLKTICDYVESETKKVEQDKYVDGLIFIYSGHGCRDEDNKTDYVVCSDNHGVPIQELMNQFGDKFCPHLMNKPKLFYFDCCRGDKGISVDDLNSPKGSKFVSRIKEIPKLNLSDYLVHYSSAPGFQSYSGPNGSYLIDAMSKEYKSHDEVYNITNDIQATVKQNSHGIECAPAENHLNSKLYLVDSAQTISVGIVPKKDDVVFSSKETLFADLKKINYLKKYEDRDITKEKDSIHITSFHVSCASYGKSYQKPIKSLSQLYDQNKALGGVVLYGKRDTNNVVQTKWTLNNRRCQSGYIIIKKIADIQEEISMGLEGMIHGAVYYSVFKQQAKHGGIIGSGFSRRGRKYEKKTGSGFDLEGKKYEAQNLNGKWSWRSGVFNSDWLDGKYPQTYHTRSKVMGDIEKGWIVEAIKHWITTGKQTFIIPENEKCMVYTGK